MTLQRGNKEAIHLGLVSMILLSLSLSLLVLRLPPPHPKFGSTQMLNRKQRE